MKKLIFPLVLEAVFIAACILLPNKTLYVYFLFYGALIIYFAKDFSFHAQVERFKDIRGFWIPVLLTAVALVLCHTIKTKVIMRFIFIPDGRISIWMPDSYIGVILFGVTTIIMGPVAEELFFRKALMKLPGDKGVKTAMVAGTFILSLLLCGLSHAIGWLGILEAVLMALPLTISYMRTRNIYIPMLVHIGFMLYENFPSVVYVIMRLSMR